MGPAYSKAKQGKAEDPYVTLKKSWSLVNAYDHGFQSRDYRGCDHA